MENVGRDNSPLIIDLDGTLVATDTLVESCLLYIKRQPLGLFKLFLWTLSGLAYLKEQLSKQVIPNAELLPYRNEVVEFAKKAKTSGREVYLITGANQKIADDVSQFYKIFTAAIGSTKTLNIVRKNKLEAIRKTIGSQEFDYIGNSKADLPIWKAANRAIVCSGSKILYKKANNVNNNIFIIIPKEKSRVKYWIKALRVYQWSKNSLLFLALFMSHRILDANLLLKSTTAFLSFSFIASSVYILNDLFDLETDRKHPTKQNRPFTAGKLPLKQGILAIPILIFFGFFLSIAFLPGLSTLTLLAYLIITTTYSLYLKEILFLDVILLGALYTLRIVAGGFASGIEVSSWLLGFSGFFFLSLAFMKRYTDLLLFKKNNQEELFGRGYSVDDMDLVQKLGTASGFVSLLILALYITSDQVLLLYSQPILLWLTIPIILYWLMNLWNKAHKGMMTDDPIIYAVKDRRSYVVFFLTVLITVAATII